MQRISVHISDEMKQRITIAAKAKNKLEAEVIREALDNGLNSIYPRSRSAQALIDLAKMAEKLPSQPGEPADISEDTAKYAFGNINE